MQKFLGSRDIGLLYGSPYLHVFPVCVNSVPQLPVTAVRVLLALGALGVAELEGDHDLRDAAEQGEEADPDQE